MHQACVKEVSLGVYTYNVDSRDWVSPHGQSAAAPLQHHVEDTRLDTQHHNTDTASKAALFTRYNASVISQRALNREHGVNQHLNNSTYQASVFYVRKIYKNTQVYVRFKLALSGHV